jgi:cyclase
MRTVSSILAAAALSLAASSVTPQESPITVRQLTDKVYLLSTDQGNYTTNTIAFVGEDGVLLVDTQSKSDAVALKRAVDAFGKGPPTYIINTHRHVEHIGGNAIFGDSPVVIAHALVPAKLRSGAYLFDEFPPATFPDITLADSLTLYFNGERVRIIAVPGSHDDNEIAVHFVDSKVVHLSSLVNGFNFPSVDSDGDVLRFPELVARAIALFPEDVVIVSGHNDIGSWDDLHSYREMLIRTTEIVRNGLAEGKDLKTLQEEHVLDEYRSYAGSYVSVDRWIQYLVDGLTREATPKPTVFEPLYHVWKERGADAAVEHYFALKREHPEEYRFEETTLLVIGIKLLENDHARDAVSFLEASLQDFPDSRYGYYTNYELADAYNRLGEREQALRYCERSLELNPEFEEALALRDALTRG